MKSAALSNGSGPGSAIALSAASIRVRDAIIEKFIDKSLDELNSFLASALDNERDESKRIGILAARVYILRNRISKITEYNENPLMSKVEDVSPHELVNSFEEDEPEITFTDSEADDEMALEDWNELVTIEDGEVNGVRIPSGVTITVGREDAARLIEMGKAVRVADDGAVLEDEVNSASDDQPVATLSSQEVVDEANQDEPEDGTDIRIEDAGTPAEELSADNTTDEDIPPENVAAEEDTDESDETQA